MILQLIHLAYSLGKDLLSAACESLLDLLLSRILLYCIHPTHHSASRVKVSER